MQDDFMNRIEAEHQEYIADIAKLSKMEIIQKAGEVAGMTEIYNYFKHGNPSAAQIDYLAQAAHPLKETYGWYSAYPHNDFERIDLVIHDICDKDHFADSEIEKFKPAEQNIRFHRKPSDLSELKALRTDREADIFKVERVVELSPEQFLHFSHNLIAESPIITENQEAMWHDGTCWHCLLVRSPGISESILVESEGYDYARYCAYVPDYSKHDFKDVPIVKYTGRTLHRDQKPGNRDER